MLALVSGGWKWVKKNDRALLVFFALIGGIYALFQYWAHGAADKEREVARYVELQDSTELLSASMELDLFQNSPAVQALRPNTYADYVGKQIDNPALLKAVLVRLNFYNALVICIDSDQCSQNLSCQYFFRQAEALIQDVRPILYKLKIRGNEGVQATEELAHDKCKSYMPAYCKLVDYASDDCAPLRGRAAHQQKP